VPAATIAHLTFSFGWAIVLARALPQRHPPRSATLAGPAIAALDLGVIGRRFPAIQALPVRHPGRRPSRLRLDGRRSARTPAIASKAHPEDAGEQSDSYCALRTCLAPGHQA